MTPKTYRIAKWGGSAVVIGCINVYFALHPSPNASPEQLSELRYHLVAAALGAAFPAFAGCVIGYFGVPVFQRWIRRRKGETNNDRLRVANEELETTPSDDALWASALQEYESASRKAGLYARLYAELGGDERKVKAAYLKARVPQMQPTAEPPNSAPATPVPGGRIDAAEKSQTPPAAEKPYRKAALYVFYVMLALLFFCLIIWLAGAPL
jgi:hypothetical protein